MRKSHKKPTRTKAFLVAGVSPEDVPEACTACTKHDRNLFPVRYKDVDNHRGAITDFVAFYCDPCWRHLYRLTPKYRGEITGATYARSQEMTCRDPRGGRPVEQIRELHIARTALANAANAVYEQRIYVDKQAGVLVDLLLVQAEAATEEREIIARAYPNNPAG